MKTFFTLALLWVFTLRLSGQCADNANIYTFTYGGKTYELVKELKSWTDAAACAVERGGYLVEINDIQEQNAVYNAITAGAGVSSTYTSVSNGGGIAYIWTGGTDQSTEGTWLWDGDNDGSGTHFWSGQGAAGAGNGMPAGNAFNYWGGYNTFNYMEPDNYGAGQNCCGLALAGWPAGTTNLGIAGEWNDIYCSSTIYYIIEFDITGSHPESPKTTSAMVYPNPVSGYFTIQKQNMIHFEIIDIKGTVVQKGSTNRGDASVLCPGLYFLKITSPSGFEVIKFIVN